MATLQADIPIPLSILTASIGPETALEIKTDLPEAVLASLQVRFTCLSF